MIIRNPRRQRHSTSRGQLLRHSVRAKNVAQPHFSNSLHKDPRKHLIGTLNKPPVFERRPRSTTFVTAILYSYHSLLWLASLIVSYLKWHKPYAETEASLAVLAEPIPDCLDLEAWHLDL